MRIDKPSRRCRRWKNSPCPSKRIFCIAATGCQWPSRKRKVSRRTLAIAHRRESVGSAQPTAIIIPLTPCNDGGKAGPVPREAPGEPADDVQRLAVWCRTRSVASVGTPGGPAVPAAGADTVRTGKSKMAAKATVRRVRASACAPETFSRRVRFEPRRKAQLGETQGPRGVWPWSRRWGWSRRSPSGRARSDPGSPRALTPSETGSRRAGSETLARAPGRLLSLLEMRPFSGKPQASSPSSGLGAFPRRPFLRGEPVRDVRGGRCPSRRSDRPVARRRSKITRRSSPGKTSGV